MEIFLIEDNKGDIHLIKHALNHVNVKIVAKTDGKAASTHLKSSETIPDLIITDLNLPYKNGFELLSEIKLNQRYNNVPVVVFTSSNNENDKALAIKLGANVYASKSLDLEEYQKQVLSFLKQVPGYLQ